MASSLFNPNQDNSTNSKKAKRILCGRFSQISTKLPRIPLRRQKLPKVVGKPQNSFSYSTAELPEAAVFYVIILSGACTTQSAKLCISFRFINAWCVISTGHECGGIHILTYDGGVREYENCGFAGYQCFTICLELNTAETMTVMSDSQWLFPFSAPLICILDDE